MNDFLHADGHSLALWSISRELNSIGPSVFADWKGGSEDDELCHQGRGRDPKPDNLFVTFILNDNENDRHLQASLDALAIVQWVAIEIIVAAPADRADEITRLAAPYDGILQLKLIACDDCRTEAEAEQRALSIARGEFIAFMAPGDLLAPSALSAMYLVLERSPKLSVIYSDEDWIDENNERRMPRFKTGWDPDAQFGFDLLGRLCLMRRKDVIDAGALRPDYAPAHHYDLHCRIANEVSPSAIRHIPKILYHRRAPALRYLPELEEARGRYSVAARRAAREAASRNIGRNVNVRASELASFINHVEWPVPRVAPLVSVLIPTRDRADLLRKCVDGILHETDYAPLELLIIDNGSVQPDTAELLKELSLDSRVRILHSPGPFNFAGINNWAAVEARGDILVFLNNDVEVISPDWLREMVGQASRPDVGCVGAKLLYPDHRIQHAGVVLQDGLLAMHVFRLMNAWDVGYDGQLAGVRGYSAVTAACLAVRKEVFERSGGFDQDNLKISFNDVDLCLQIDEMGYRNLCTPFATLLHFEGASRNSDQSADAADQGKRELNFLVSKWPDRFGLDPFDHPELQLSWNDPVRFAPNKRNACQDVVSR